jgi:Zn finger protein HypA/HybF involved in hydrogenase expression
MVSEQAKLELICKSGHNSEHPKSWVLRHKGAWCPKCGTDIAYDPVDEGSALPKAA